MERELLEAANPLAQRFTVRLSLNGKALERQCAQSTVWICPRLLPEGLDESRSAKALLEYYGLDLNESWVIWRESQLYATKRRPEIKGLSLSIESQPVTVGAFCFNAPAVGESISFSHPVSGDEIQLTVEEYENHRLETPVADEDKLIRPKCFTAMAYSTEPHMPRDKLRIYDSDEGDSPIDISSGKKRLGGATGIIISSSKGNVCCSSLRFEHKEDILWCLSIMEKLKTDVEVSLI